MNWLFIVTVLVMILFTFIGMKRGLVKIAMSMLSLVISLVLVSIVTPYVSDFLTNHTPVYDTVKESCVESLSGVMREESTKLTDQLSIIDSLPLPESIKEGLADNNNSEVYGILKVDTFVEYMGGYIAKTIINIVAYIITFVIIFIGLRIFMHTLNFLTELPVLKGINKLGGLLIGFMQGIICIWLFMLLITLFSNTDFGRIMFAMMDQSQFLTFMYKNNILLNLIFKFTIGA
jgi:uncharacterized membrane protein required for colicin V production